MLFISFSFRLLRIVTSSIELILSEIILKIVLGICEIMNCSIESIHSLLMINIFFPCRGISSIPRWSRCSICFLGFFFKIIMFSRSQSFILCRCVSTSSNNEARWLIYCWLICLIISWSWNLRSNWIKCEVLFDFF